MNARALVMLLCVGVVCAWGPPALPATAFEALEFEDAAQERTYKALIAEVRCPRCQNVNLAGSDAPIAKDLRITIYRLLREGRSEREILAFLQQRYGDFVLYDPPLKPSTYFLWFTPVVLFLLGLVVLVRVSRGQPKTVPLAAQERAELDRLLSTTDASDLADATGDTARRADGPTEFRQ